MTIGTYRMANAPRRRRVPAAALTRRPVAVPGVPERAQRPWQASKSAALSTLVCPTGQWAAVVT
jgi:hypothetical protein